ncbi:Acyl-CoA dehydrogenase/oxidase C-terminal, partial [Cynara cardunculus var. scolymus]
AKKIVANAFKVLSRAVCIITRYSAVRRQFRSCNGGPETQVINYKTQQSRLFPLLASAYAFRFMTGLWLIGERLIGFVYQKGKLLNYCTFTPAQVLTLQYTQLDLHYNDKDIITSSSYLSNDLEDKTPLDDHVFQKYSSLKAGHPVLRVEGSNLLAAVIVKVDEDVRDMLMAASFVLVASEAVAYKISSSQRKWWEAYARLYKMNGGVNQGMGIGVLFWRSIHSILELEYCHVNSVNRRKQKMMRKVWVHGKFQKP